MAEVTYTVKGIHCQSCVAHIRESVGDVTGVTSVDVELGNDLVVVHGDSIDDQAIRAAISSTGYEAA